MSDKFGMMDNAYFTGKGEILKWLNTTLRMNLTKIEQGCTGAVYCQIIDAIHPGKVKMAKVNWKAALEHEFIGNLKLLQQALSELGIRKEIDIQKLSKGKYQDNFELFQWLKGYFDNQCPDLSHYDPEKRRNNAELTFGKEKDKSKDKENKKAPLIQSVPNRKRQINQSFCSNKGFNNFSSMNSHQSKSKEHLTSDKLITCIDKVNIEVINSNNKNHSRSNSNNKNNSNKTIITHVYPSNNKTDTIQEAIPSREEIENEIRIQYEEKMESIKEEVNKNKREIATLKMLLAEVGKEKEFYYSKLRDFEFLAIKPTNSDKLGLINLIQEILISKTEVELNIDEYGNPSLKQIV